MIFIKWNLARHLLSKLFNYLFDKISIWMILRTQTESLVL